MVVGGTAGCLGLGDDDEEAGEPENETDDKGSEDASTEPNGEGNETTDTETPDDTQSNDTGSDDVEGSEPEDDDSSILEEESNDNESDDDDENDSGGDQANLDNEPDDNETDAEGENDTDNKTQKNDTAEESPENLDNDSNANCINKSSDGDENDSESNQDESEEEREFEQIIIEELSYQVDYPADWEMVETDESIPVVIANSDETAWIWINIRETSLDLEGDITNYRQNFEPNPDFEILEDEPMTLSSGEDGHRFVIEVSENPENPLIAHELLANENGNEYMTSVQVSRPEYDEDYAQLAEEILASVDLS